MILKEIIVILFFFTFICNASEQYPTPNALWIGTDFSGKQFQPGDWIDWEVMAPENYDGTYSILLVNREIRSVFVTLQSEVYFEAGLNKFSFEIPSNLEPSPVYFINFRGPNREDYSATFTIGEPGYGVTIVSPAAGTVMHPGDILEASWYGNYDKPDVDDIHFIHALLEPAVNSDRPRTYLFLPDSNREDMYISFESQYLQWRLPDDILAPRVWKFGFLFNTSDGSFSTIVSSGSFLINPEDDDQPPSDSEDPEDPEGTDSEDPEYTDPEDPEYTDPEDPDYSYEEDPDYSYEEDPDYSYEDHPYEEDPDYSYEDHPYEEDPDYSYEEDPDYSYEDHPRYEEDPRKP
ncbi:16426_t:CDS:2 [Racocetra persica]|uniref:16426_t:CDS:1 n=1 Tax=Racocetra persica TaxID=160502 RepID=A0ACA9P689_9GLOM|nr:16426_t:CDS:2 [Racocetra persica]